MQRKSYLSKLMGKARKRLGYSQTIMAQKVGVGQSAWARYELGSRMPSIQVLNTLKTLLGGKSEQKLAEVLTIAKSKSS